MVFEIAYEYNKYKTSDWLQIDLLQSLDLMKWLLATRDEWNGDGGGLDHLKSERRAGSVEKASIMTISDSLAVDVVSDSVCCAESKSSRRVAGFNA